MALIVKVKQSQITPNIGGVRPQATFFVDDTLTVGLTHGKFITTKTDGTADGNAEATLTYAGAAASAVTYGAGVLAAGAIVVPQKKALGIQYEASAIDPLGRKDNFTDSVKLLPKGRLEEKRIGFVTDAVLEITDTTSTNGRYFRTANDLLGTATTQTGTSTFTIILTGDVTTRVRAGDRVLNNGVYAQVVSAVFSTPSTTITTLTGGYGDTNKATYTVGQIGEIGYLADDMTGDLPFVFTVPTTGKLKQKVGYVESAVAFRIKLDVMDADVV